jgi:hypothetical protein
MPKASISLIPFIIWVPLFYLVLLSFPPPGPLVLLSPTQFCPSDKHFLTFPPLLVLLNFSHLYSLADL